MLDEQYFFQALRRSRGAVVVRHNYMTQAARGGLDQVGASQVGVSWKLYPFYFPYRHRREGSVEGIPRVVARGTIRGVPWPPQC
jgi:hypothetical protein